MDRIKQMTDYMDQPLYTYMDMHRTCMMHDVPSYIAVRI